MMHQALLAACALFVAARSQICGVDSDCNDGQICADDLRCYGYFNATAFGSLSLATGADPNALTDVDASSVAPLLGEGGSITCTQFAFTRISFTGLGLWLHGGTISCSDCWRMVTKEVSINGGDPVGMELVGQQLLLANTLPVVLVNLSLTFFTLESDMSIESIMLYGAATTPEPSTEPTLGPAGMDLRNCEAFTHTHALCRAVQVSDGESDGQSDQVAVYGAERDSDR